MLGPFSDRLLVIAEARTGCRTDIGPAGGWWVHFVTFRGPRLSISIKLRLACSSLFGPATLHKASDRLQTILIAGGMDALDEQTRKAMHNFSVTRDAVTKQRQPAEFPAVTQVEVSTTTPLLQLAATYS